MITKEEQQAQNYIKTIAKLEQRERNMLDKLKKTQTQHAAVAEDLERINKNQEPIGPLSMLKGELSARKSFTTLSRATPTRERPAPQVKPVQPTPQSQNPNTQKAGTSYYDRMYGEHQLYNVTDYYR